MSTGNPLSSVPNGVDISPLANSMFVGVLISPVLWGITISQTWTYYTSNRDGWMLRSFVGFLFLMDTVETILTSEMAHVYLIQNFGNLEALTELPVSAIAEVAINVVMVFLVELFFAQRVYLFNRKILMPALISIFAVAGLITGMLIVATESESALKVSALAQGTMKVQVALTNAFQATSDFLATVALSWAFYQGRGGVKSTNSVLDQLLAFTVARGGIVTISQFLTLALYVAQPTKLNWMPVHFMLGKLCVITMMVILNSRDALRAKASMNISDNMFTDSVVGHQTGPQFQLRSLDTMIASRTGDSKASHNVGGIHIEQVIEYDGAKQPV